MTESLQSGGFKSALTHAFEWRRRWRNHAPTDLALGDRDIVALSLIVQLAHAACLRCDDPRLAGALRETLSREDTVWICGEDEDKTATGASSPVIVLAHGSTYQSSTLTDQLKAGRLVILYGLNGGTALRVVGEIHLRLLATVNPCLWNSGLALVVSPDGIGHTSDLIDRLSALLGDQSLDPLQLYEELCRAQRSRLSDTSTTPGVTTQDYVALRRFVCGAIERAALNARRERARSAPHVPVDWATAFLMPTQVDAVRFDKADTVTEAEARARQARVEAEFLRTQLYALSRPREIDAHGMIATSGFFDLAWYAETYNVSPETAIQHYIDIGAQLGYDPSPLFSTKSYLTLHQDVNQYGFNALMHYLMDGIYEGRAIEPAVSISQKDWIGATGERPS